MCVVVRTSSTGRWLRLFLKEDKSRCVSESFFLYARFVEMVYFLVKLLRNCDVWPVGISFLELEVNGAVAKW